MTALRRIGFGVAGLLVLIPALLLLRPAQGGTRPVAAASSALTVVVDGTARDYRLYVPPGPSALARPLLLALHPLHSSASLFEVRSQLDAGARRLGVAVAYPDGIDNSWDAGTCCQPAASRGVDDIAFLRAVVADVERRTPIDRSRMAVTGFSNGALMSYRLVCQAADLVHVAVAVAGDLVVPNCRPSRSVSVLHVHGGRDEVIPIAGIGSSPLDTAGFPAATESIDAIAAADQCAGPSTVPGARVDVTTMHGCADGSLVELMTSHAMGHTYPIGRVAAAYGVDMSRLTWQFLRAAWRAG